MEVIGNTEKTRNRKSSERSQLIEQVLEVIHPVRPEDFSSSIRKDMFFFNQKYFD